MAALTPAVERFTAGDPAGGIDGPLHPRLRTWLEASRRSRRSRRSHTGRNRRRHFLPVRAARCWSVAVRLAPSRAGPATRALHDGKCDAAIPQGSRRANSRVVARLRAVRGFLAQRTRCRWWSPPV
jgi:hypothetical protein